MEYLSRIDYVFIGLYFLSLIVLGIYLRKKASGSVEDYFLAGRNLPWWALAFSGSAWWFSISGSMIIIAFLYMLGPRGLFIEFRGGACLLMLIPMLWAGKWHRRSQCVTGAEYLIFRFGDTAGARFSRIVTSIATLATSTAMLGMFIKAVGLFISTFVPFTPLQCELTMIIVATLYTVISGFYGVVYTDIFQSFFVLIVVVIISIMAILKVNNIDEISSLAQSVTENSQWLTSYPQLKTTMPEGGEFKQYEYLLMFTIFYLIRNLLAGTGAGAAPMYFGARNDRDCGKLTFAWGSFMMFRWPMMMGFAVLGIYMVSELFGNDTTQIQQAVELIKTNFPDISKSTWANTLANIGYNPGNFSSGFINELKGLLGTNWIQKLQLLGYDGNIDPERILPSVVLFQVPAGIRGVIIITLLAAFMSTFDSTVNYTTAFFTRDLYQGYIRKKASNKELITISWLFSILLVAAGWLFGFYSKSLNDMWAWIVMGIGSGGVISGTLMHYWWRISGAAFGFAWILGVIGAVVYKAMMPWLAAIYGPIINNEIFMFTVIVLINLLATILAVIIFPSSDLTVLKNYYKTVRPYGIWGPAESALSDAERKDLKKEMINNLLALPFGIIWLTTLFMWPMQLIIHNWSRFGIAFGLFVISLIGLYYFWYRNLARS